MANPCPACGMYCYCGGDIDDFEFDDPEAEMNCTHCPDDEDETGDDDPCD